MKRVTLRNGRNPFQAALVAVCVVVGLLGLLIPIPGPSPAVVRTFGGAGSQIFYLLMAVSALIVLAGAFWPRGSIRQLAVGMRVEQTGLLPLGGACAAYGVATLSINGVSSVLAGGLIAGIALACWIRARIISTDMRELDGLIKLDLKRTSPLAPPPTPGGDSP